MNNLPPYDRAATEKAWKYYIRDRHEIPGRIDGVRPLIVESWRRSRSSGDPSAPGAPGLSRSRLQAVLKENALLMQIAYPYLQDFSQEIGNSHLQITLADRHGWQIARIAPEAGDSGGGPYPLEDGTDFSEAAAGTNGIGTSLALRQPVMIFGAEHYQARYHGLACYAAPVYDPAGGLLGSINITGPLDDWDPLILCVLKTAISGIQKEFELTRKNRMLDTLIESCGQGVILLDAKERILYCNAEAASVFHAEGRSLTGQPVGVLIDTGKLPQALRHFRTALTDEDCTLTGADGRPLRLNLTVRPAGQNYHGMNSILILLRSQKYVHQLTTRLAGFAAVCSFDSLVGTSRAIRIVTEMGRIAAGQTVPVLLSGERGTGKQMLAQAIHHGGPDPDAPFVELHCASTPAAQLDAELFGRRNAETGAGIPGRIRLAEGGTLYLDEIGALPENLQKKLADLLQDAEDPARTSPRFRLIASSSEDLLSLIRKGVFREDLYYRLNALTITIPPLRERREDIAVSAEYFAQQITGHPVRLSEEAAAALASCSWPGNLRELEETVRLSVRTPAQEQIVLSDLPAPVSNRYYASFRDRQQNAAAGAPDASSPPDAADGGVRPAPADTAACDAAEYYRLTRALQDAGGNVQEAADRLGIPRSSLYRRLRKLNIRAKEYRKLP